MLKILFTFFSLLVYAQAYITIDANYNTGGGASTQTLEDNFFSKIGISNCSSNCSDEWFFNATSTENLKLNKNTLFYNSNIITDEHYKVQKNLSPEEFIKYGIKFFKAEALENKDRTGHTDYNVFVAVRKIDAKTLYKETITKSNNSFSISNQNKENKTIHLNTENVFGSYLFGQIDVNVGLISGYIYRNRIVSIKGQKYHFIELEKINFRDNLVNKYNEYCSNPINVMFPMIYEPYNFYYSFLDQVNPNFTNTLNLNTFIYPNQLLSNPDLVLGIKTGMLGLPCDQNLMGNDPYNKISNLSTIIDKSKITNFDSYPGFGKTAIQNEANKYFEHNGYFLKIHQMESSNIFNLGVSFLNGIMQDRKIETGIIVKDNRINITNKDWKTGKCPTHHNKKTIHSKNSDVYFLTSLVEDMPFNEKEANFNITSSIALSAYSPIPIFPNNEETIFALTPDNHLLTHSLSTTDMALINTLMLSNGNKLNTTNSLALNVRSWQQHCSSFGLFAFILLIILIVVTIYTGGAAAGLWGAGGMAGGVGVGAGSIVTTYASGAVMMTGSIIGVGGLGLSAATVAMISAIGAYVAYGYVWSGYDTSVGQINQYSNTEKTAIYENIDGIQSGSSFYLNFLNLEKTLNSMDNKSYSISPKQYKEITGKALQLRDGSSISGYEDTDLLGLNTSPEVSFLYAITYSHAEPATLPPNYRYFGYSPIQYKVNDSNSYTWNTGEIFNLSHFENHLSYTMSGYQLDGSAPNGNKFDLFHTFDIMKKIVNKYNNQDFNKYEN